MESFKLESRKEGGGVSGKPWPRLAVKAVVRDAKCDQTVGEIEVSMLVFVLPSAPSMKESEEDA